MSNPIVIALPNAGFDPSEAAVPWQMLRNAGFSVIFATPDGSPAQADPLMVTGEGLDFWGWVPGLKKLKLVGLALRADSRARKAYATMIQDEAFLHPHRYEDINVQDIDGLVLPGGHAKPIRAYLESKPLQELVVNCLATGSAGDHVPVAAVCHGVLVLARATKADGTSAIASRSVTALTWAFERKAWQLNRVVRFWDPNYYRTYLEQPGEPAGYWSVEHEIKRSLTNPQQFLDVPRTAPDYRLKTDGMHRDTAADSRPAWVVQDGNLITARWPGDVHTFARALIETVQVYRNLRVRAPQLQQNSLA